MAKWESESYQNGDTQIYTNALGNVVMFFTPYQATSFTPEQAKEVAEALVKYAEYGEKLKKKG